MIVKVYNNINGTTRFRVGQGQISTEGSPVGA